MVATDGIVASPDEEGGVIMGAGIYPRNGDGMTRAIPVRGEIASMLPEGAAIEYALANFPKNEPLAIVTDCAVMLYFIEAITRDTFWKSYDKHRFETLLARVATALQGRESHMLFIKVEAHQGQEMNEAADYMANKGTTNPDHDPMEYGMNKRYMAAEVRISDARQDRDDVMMVTRGCQGAAPPYKICTD